MGRKKLPEGAKVDVRLRMGPDLQARVRAAADRQGNSVAAWLRATVVKELERQKKGKVG